MCDVVRKANVSNLSMNIESSTLSCLFDNFYRLLTCTFFYQINTSGQMFHIDFGFIFGQDPKPMPPPFRFIRQMADAMGGEDGENYARFKTFCCQVCFHQLVEHDLAIVKEIIVVCLGCDGVVNQRVFLTSVCVGRNSHKIAFLSVHSYI